MSSRNKNLEREGIRAVFILEIIGRPAEHLTETLNKLIDEIGREKGVQVIEKKIKEPVKVKDQKDFYTTFAEVEIKTEGISHIAGLMFRYMPANIEIIEPELIALSNNGWSDILSELTRRLHGYDEVTRVLQMQNAQMKKKLEETGGGEVKKEVSEEGK